MSRRPILVTGGTGKHGGTGYRVATNLINAGRKVRVLARKDDERAEALRHLGVEVAIGDFFNYPSLIAALEGVAEATFCYPVREGIVQAATTFAAAGRESELRRIIHLSMGPAFPESPSPLGRAQWLAEQVLDWAGFDCVHLRIASFFFENIPTLHGHTIRQEKLIRNSFGAASPTWMAGDDAADLVSSLLLDSNLSKERILAPTGGECFNHAQIAELLSKILGETIRYEEITPEKWQEELNNLSKENPCVTPSMAEHITRLSRALRSKPAFPPNDGFSQITGRTPTTFEAYFNKHRHLFLS